MADWWVSTSGTNTASGTNYASAWKQVHYAMGRVNAVMAQGDTLNIVNDGTHVLVAQSSDFVNGFTGTDFTSDWGFRMRGTDSSGNPELTEIQIPNTNGTYELLRPQVGSDYFLCEGLHFTEAAGAATNANVNVALFEIGTSPGGNAWRFQNCMFDFGDDTAVDGNRWICFSDASRTTEVQFANCYFRNINGFAIGRGGSAVLGLDGVNFSRCVFLNEWPGQDFLVAEGGLAAGATFSMTHCTFANIYANSVTTIQGSIIGAQVDGSADNGTGTIKDNLYISCVTGDGSSIATKVTLADIFYNLNSHTFVFNTSDVDYNGYFGQTAAVTATGIEPYDNPFADGANTPKVNDVTGLYTDVDSLVNDYTASYSWVVGSYTLDIPDLRPAASAMLTGASDGGELGALEGANQPPVAGAVTYTATAGSLLTVNSTDGLLSNSSDPDLDTLSVSVVTPSTNTSFFTYSKTTGAFQYTANDIFAGTDTFTFQVYDGIIWSNVSTATLDVDPYPVTPPDIDAPSITNVIDTAPFFKPDLRVETILRYKSRKNRVKFKDLANYTEGHRWEESTHRIINLATNSSTQLTLGGVATGEYLMVETDNQINVSINDDSRYWTINKAVSVALTSFTTVYLQNESTTDEAQAIVIVVD